MKLRSLYEEVLNEQKIVYHGTDSKFNDFDLEKVGSSDGRSLGGWGIYLTDDQDVARQYMTDSGTIHKYEIKRGNFFDFDDVLAGHEDYIQSAINKHEEMSDDDKSEFQSDFVEYSYDVTNKQVYEWLAIVLGSEKQASIFLRNLGFDGNKFMDKTTPSVTNYVVYDLSIIKRLDVDDSEDFV